MVVKFQARRCVHHYFSKMKSLKPNYTNGSTYSLFSSMAGESQGFVTTGGKEELLLPYIGESVHGYFIPPLPMGDSIDKSFCKTILQEEHSW